MMKSDCISRTHVGHKRKLNEDALFASVEQQIWVVADGMGGHDAGEVASAMVIDALRHLPPATNVADKALNARSAIERVNTALIDLARSAGRNRTIGTTVVGLIADDVDYCCFWVGDSRCYLVRDGAISRLTRDHSLVQDLVDAGMLEAERADDHPNANVLTRAVGASAQLKVDTIGGQIAAGDVFLLASDGLTRLVREGEMLEVLTSLTLEDAADRLLHFALTRGGPDNISLVIMQVRCDDASVA